MQRTALSLSNNTLALSSARGILIGTIVAEPMPREVQVHPRGVQPARNVVACRSEDTATMAILGAGDRRMSGDGVRGP